MFWFNVATLAAATVPVVMLEPLSAVSAEPLPLTLVKPPAVAEILPALTLPVTPSDVSVPTEVMFGCAAVVTVLADPETEPVIVAVTDSPDRVPTEVMLGCAAVYTVPETSAFAT